MISKLSVRERLIKTASELFYIKGFNSTGINEIIEKANVAKASLYSHFKTKDDLLIAYLNEREEQFMFTLKLFINKQGSGATKVLSLYDFLFYFFETDEFRGCWCVNTLSEIQKGNEKVKKVILGHKRRLLSFIEQTIKENISVDNAEKLSKQLYLLYEGAVMESYLQKNNWPIKEAKEIASKII